MYGLFGFWYSTYCILTGLTTGMAIYLLMVIYYYCSINLTETSVVLALFMLITECALCHPVFSHVVKTQPFLLNICTLNVCGGQ